MVTKVIIKSEQTKLNDKNTTFFKQLLLYNINFTKLLTITGRDKKMKISKKRKRLP